VQGVGEHGEVGDAFLEEVAGAFGDVLDVGAAGGTLTAWPRHLRAEFPCAS
jgi:hypothetical protein